MSFTTFIEKLGITVVEVHIGALKKYVQLNMIDVSPLGPFFVNRQKWKRRNWSDSVQGVTMFNSVSF